MNEALLIAGMAAVTFGARYLPMAVLRRFTLPDPLLRGLSYVAPVVLMAIIAPTMLMPVGNRPDLSLENGYLWAGLLSFVIAWRWKNLLLTIVAGMGLFLLWRLIGR
jgi:branched-subunit amino acid transport protein